MGHILYKNNQFILKASSLANNQKQYVEEYLSKVNGYKAIGFHENSPVFSLYQPPLATPVGIRSLQQRLKRRFENIKIPATATISITKACQCDCSHCSAVFYNKSPKKNLTGTELAEAVFQTVELGVTTIILLGGEPLLRRDLGNLINSVPKEKATVILFTNGELLTSEMCRLLKKNGLMGAFVSLDSVDEKEHDRLRKRHGLFYRALRGIENLREAGLIAGISSYLSPLILAKNGFKQMMELAKEIGAQEVTFFDAIPSGRWLKDQNCLLKETDRKVIKELVSYYRKNPAYPGLSVQSTMTCGDGGSSFCFAANTQFYLTATGQMCPCDFTPLTIGKFPEQSIGELWNKMINTQPYHQRAKGCRMQDLEFRKKYIDNIPDSGPFPYPL